MNNFKVLEHAIKDELEKLKQLEKEKDGLLKGRPSNYTLRAGGSVLHDFYTGIEKIFEDIAKEVDRRIPMGDGWQKLLPVSRPHPGIKSPLGWQSA